MRVRPSLVVLSSLFVVAAGTVGVSASAAPPGPPTQALIARALGLHDWPAVLAGLAEVRQQVTAFWHELT